MEISNLIRTEFETVSCYAGTDSVRKSLLKHGALVVLDEDTHIPVGLLTMQDLIQKPHNLVIDCISHKPKLDYKSDLVSAIQIMREHGSEALPVYSGERLIGLAFKGDLIGFISMQIKELREQMQENAEQLILTSENLVKSEQMLKSMYDSTTSTMLLVSPDYHILFFNRKAYDTALAHYNKILKIGDNLLEYVEMALGERHTSLGENFDKALKGEYVSTDREIVLHGAILWIGVEYCPVFDKGIPLGVSITVIDISQRKKSELMVAKQNSLLREIMFTQSHEVRAPVARILGLISLLDKTGLSEDNKVLIDLLDRSTNDLDNIIRAIVKKSYSLES